MLSITNPAGCCCDCVVDTDDFNRADAGTPGVKWDVRSGSWPIVSNKLSAASSNGLVTFSTAPPSTYCLQAVGRTDTSGDVLRLVFDYVDDSNYYFADFTFSNTAATSRIQIGSRIAGVETTIYETRLVSPFGFPVLGLNSDVLLNVAASGDRFSAWATNYTASIGTSAIGVPFTPLGGTKVGLGTGSISGNVTFDEVYLMKSSFADGYDPDDTRCIAEMPCFYPGENVGPRQFKIVLAGYSGQGVLCFGDDTSEFNGTHYTTPFYQAAPPAANDGGCSYLYNNVTTLSNHTFFCSGTMKAYVLLTLAATSITVLVGSQFAGYTTFTKTMSADYTTWDILNLDIPLSVDSSGSTGTPTCTITGIPL